MSDSENPFSQPRKGAASIPKGSVVAWAMAVLMACVALFLLMVWSQAKTNERQKLKALQTELDAAQAKLGDLQTQNQTNQDLIASLQQQVATLENEKEQAGQMSKSLEDEMRSELESKDVAISKLQGQLTVTILDQVLFDSGEALLKPDGQAVMKKIAAILTEHTNIKIMVIGHTDNVPIRSGAKSRFASNWELSTARALAAVHFLTEQAGVDPHRVGAVGYGEYRPIADNSTPEGRARNRRIEIIILPNDLSETKPVQMKTSNDSSSATNAVKPTALPEDESEGVPTN